MDKTPLPRESWNTRLGLKHSCTSPTKTGHIRKVGAAAACCPHRPSARLVTPHRQRSPEPVAPPGGKESPGWRPSSAACVLLPGSPNSGLAPWRLWGTPWDWLLGVWLWWRSREGLVRTLALGSWQTEFHGRPAAPGQRSQLAVLLMCRTKSVVPSDKVVGWGCRSPDLGPWMKRFASPGSRSVPSQACELSHGLDHF